MTEKEVIMSRCLETVGEEMKKALNKTVLIKLRNGVELRGRLRGFDIHLNILLDDAEELIDKDVVKRGIVLIRGDTIVLISPLETPTG